MVRCTYNSSSLTKGIFHENVSHEQCICQRRLKDAKHSHLEHGDRVANGRASTAIAGSHQARSAWHPVCHRAGEDHGRRISDRAAYVLHYQQFGAGRSARWALSSLQRRDSLHHHRRGDISPSHA